MEWEKHVNKRPHTIIIVKILVLFKGLAKVQK